MEAPLPIILETALLCDAIAPAALFPPHGRIFRAVQHLGQFFLDFRQPVSAHFHCRLVDLAVRTPVNRTGVHVAQIRDFLTKAGEMFQDIWHASIIPQIRPSALLNRLRNRAFGLFWWLVNSEGHSWDRSKQSTCLAETLLAKGERQFQS
jgi:hypothetical protein